MSSANTNSELETNSVRLWWNILEGWICFRTIFLAVYLTVLPFSRHEQWHGCIEWVTEAMMDVT